MDGSKIILNKLLLRYNKLNLFEMYEYVCFGSNKSSFMPDNFENITVIWFLPDFGIGSGGHLNIFRMIYNLSKFGVKSDIAICGKSQWVNVDIAKKMIDKHFFKLNSEVAIIENKDDMDKLKGYHIAMATSWQTAYYVNYFSKCYKKAYFIQDFEPFFYPVGSDYVFAENTYKFGFYGITAGHWLSDKLSKEYNMRCENFSFSYDKELYTNIKREKDNKKVFFYARPPTSRRAFELGLLALKKLCDLNPDIEVVFAGWDISDYDIPFKHSSLGILELKELPKVYAQCDVALILSLTNLSLLPLELLASGCPVVCNEGSNNSWIDKDKKLFIYAKIDVDSIVEKLNGVLHGEISLDFDYIKEFLNKTSWEKESKVVYKILENILKVK